MYYIVTVALTLRKGAVFGRDRFVEWRQRLTDSFLSPIEIACTMGRKRLTGKVRVRVRVSRFFNTMAFVNPECLLLPFFFWNYSPIHSLVKE